VEESPVVEDVASVLIIFQKRNAHPAAMVSQKDYAAIHGRKRKARVLGSSAVLDDFSLDHIDNFLANIGGVVANPLQVSGD